jgi:MFS family permease
VLAALWGTAFTFPAVTALLSRVVPSKQRGLYMGVQQTVGGVSRVVVPWWDGGPSITSGWPRRSWSAAS